MGGGLNHKFTTPTVPQAASIPQQFKHILVKSKWKLQTKRRKQLEGETIWRSETSYSSFFHCKEAPTTGTSPSPLSLIIITYLHAKFNTADRLMH